MGSFFASPCRFLFIVFGACFALSYLASCDYSRRYSIQTYTEPKGSELANAERDIAAESLTWTMPRSWQAKAADGMRLASFIVPGSSDSSSELGKDEQKTKPGDASIIVMEGDGGGIVANVNLWRGQVDLPALSEAEISVLARHDTGMLGDFQWYRLRGAETIIYAAVYSLGAKTVFVKMSAPVATAKANEQAFLQLCKSIGAENA